MCLSLVNSHLSGGVYDVVHNATVGGRRRCGRTIRMTKQHPKPREERSGSQLWWWLSRGLIFPELSKNCILRCGEYACKTMSVSVGAGEEITQMIMDHLGDRVAKECDGVQITDNHTRRHEFRMKSENVKKSMRSGTAVPFSFMDVKPDTSFTGSFTPDEFIMCTAGLLKTVEEALKGLAGAKGINVFTQFFYSRKVESIVLTGGSTRLPFFGEKLKGIFPKAVLKETINAEEAAAIGAVIVAQHIPLASDDGGRLKLFKEIEQQRCLVM